MYYISTLRNKIFRNPETAYDAARELSLYYGHPIAVWYKAIRKEEQTMIAEFRDGKQLV